MLSFSKDNIMSEVINPPDYYFTGVNFNPAFYADEAGNLSIEEANALYLRKTVPDTATAVETFNSGIITPSVSSTGALDIVMPNALATDVLNVGVVSRNILGQIHHYSDGDNCVAGAGVHINNGINNDSNTNIMNGNNTSGTLNLMTGTGNNFVNIGGTSTTLALKGTTSMLGATSINTTGGLNTIIGTPSLGSVAIKGLTVSLGDSTTVNIQTTSISDNTKSTTIGTTNGGFSTLTTVNGRLTTVGLANINTTGTSNTNIGNTGSINTILGGTNINNSGANNTFIGNTGSTTTIVGPTNINTTGTSLTTIGNDSGGTTTLSSDTINIGNADTVTTMNATNIKQVIKAVSGDLIENIIGDTTATASMSTTFNRKYSSPVGGDISCYTITANSSDQFTNQYFEIYVSGANSGRGGYTYKGCFGVEKLGGSTITQTSVNTLFYHGTGVNPPTSTVIPVITFSLTGQVLTLSVNTSGGGSSNQSFITTLSSFPTCNINSVGSPALEDFIITAV